MEKQFHYFPASGGTDHAGSGSDVSKHGLLALNCYFGQLLAHEIGT
jgi:hypothetical protein